MGAALDGIFRVAGFNPFQVLVGVCIQRIDAGGCGHQIVAPQFLADQWRFLPYPDLYVGHQVGIKQAQSVGLVKPIEHPSVTHLFAEG